MFVIWSWSESRVRFRASKIGLSPAHRFKPRPPSNFSPDCFKATFLLQLFFALCRCIHMWRLYCHCSSSLLLFAALGRLNFVIMSFFGYRLIFFVLSSTIVILSTLYKNILLETNPSGHMTSIQSRVNVDVASTLMRCYINVKCKLECCSRVKHCFSNADIIIIGLNYNIYCLIYL